MFLGFILAVPVIVLPTYYVSKAYKVIEITDLENTLIQFNNYYKSSVVSYGILSGILFIIISIVLLINFRIIFVLINKGTRLSESLQN